MGASRWWSRLGATAVAAEVVGYLAWRPRMLRWGATVEEAAEALPGDDRTPHPRMQSTRAITIDAPPEEVWPWLVQMGIGRAGFYTHDWVERLMFRACYVDGRHSATTIHPELQDLSVGDSVPMGADAYAPVTAMVPPEYLVAQEAFVLRRLPGGGTRLITRYRGVGYCLPAVEAIAPDAGLLPRALRFAFLRVPGLALVGRALDFFVLDLLHHYMETGMIKGIKARAEGRKGDGHAHQRAQSPSLGNGGASATTVEPVAAAD